MKKLSFFLMAMLMSIMGFAADYPATNTSNVSFTLGTKAYDNKIKIEGIEYQAIKLGTSTAIGDMSFTIPANTAKIHLHIAGWSGKSSAVTISASNGVTLGTAAITATSDAGMTGNSPFTLSDASKVTTDYYHVIELSSPTTAETTITMTSVSGKCRVVIWGVNTEEATSGEQGETVDAPTFSATEANFTEAFNLTITSAEGTTLKYTTDKTDPTTSATAVVVESNTVTVAIPAKSTRVMAVAIKGELVSNVKSMTYCYVNSEATAYTVTEALAIYNEGLGLSNKLYIKGSVKSIEELNTEYGNATYTITDGESDLYIYRGKNFGGEKFTSADQLFVNDDLVLYGQLTSYNGNPQVAANSEIISRESKTKSILAEDLTFDAIALGDEVEAQTLTVTGANLTADIAATLDNEKFTVTPATLPAAGGDLTITPAADLTAGEHTAILTLTSGETVKEVALSILVKDVYSINWSVNGTIANETKVVAGDKLVLPVAPAAPDACSEKVFVGWATTSTVNADGSDIDYVTNATVPTESTTYYAVFATQEGEGGAAEVVDVLNRDMTGVEGTSYTSWADVSATSTAVYAGQSAGGNEAIQLRSNNSNSGVISTTSGGKLAKITVTWNSNTASDRTLNVYGSNTAYTSPTELYGDASGEKLGTIVNGTSTELVIDGDYAYVGLRSNSGAMYLDEIQITWTTGTAATYTDYSTTCVAPVVNHTITVSANPAEGGVVTGGGEFEETDEITVKAVANDGYEFVNWTENEVEVSTDAEYTFEVLADRALVANFKEVEPEVIAYELNGGELPAPAVPTNEELWIAFMPYYQEYYDVVRAEQPIASVAVFLSAGMGDDATIFTSEDSDYKWLGDYIIKVTTEQSAALTTLANWKFNAQAFFNANQYTGWPKSADFTEAGKPENWGAAYQAAHAVVLPTEPVDAPYTLPTPVKEGFTFVGWYDNAEGTGEAYTVIPAGWSGTLYAIWEVEGPATALENIAVEGKAVKAIINGQLIIIKNGVQYNAQGAVVK